MEKAHELKRTCRLFLLLAFAAVLYLAIYSKEIQNASYHPSRISASRIFGHVHMAKTAGTSVNGELAVHFERVCGHKGYSYDAFQANERTQNSEAEIKDSFAKMRKGFSRQRVPYDFMDEIGYENCDWISQELSARFWNKFTSWPLPLELHLPCREPVDHLMSLCNFKNAPFDCEQDIPQQVRRCVGWMDRFSMQLANSKNMELKCYDFNKTFPGYIQYMAKRLERKKIEREYVFVPTNKDRVKSQECIWDNNHVQEAVRAYLVASYDYYKFCDTCIGSAKELRLGE
jgi:hypothetical protein